MDAVAAVALDSANATPSDEPRALRLTPLAPGSSRSFALTHPYIELVYASRLGPTAVLVVRYVGRMLAARDDPVDIDPVLLARELGLRASHDEPLGRRSHLRHAFDRLAHARFVRWIGDRHLGVRTAVPPVADGARDKLPPAARRAHDHFLEVIDVRAGSGNGDRA